MAIMDRKRVGLKQRREGKIVACSDGASWHIEGVLVHLICIRILQQFEGVKFNLDRCYKSRAGEEKDSRIFAIALPINTQSSKHIVIINFGQALVNPFMN